MVGTRALLGAAAAAAACAEAPGVLVRATAGVAAGNVLRAGTAVAVLGVPASVRHTRCDLDTHVVRLPFKFVCAELCLQNLMAVHLLRIAPASTQCYY